MPVRPVDRRILASEALVSQLLRSPKSAICAFLGRCPMIQHVIHRFPGVREPAGNLVELMAWAPGEDGRHPLGRE
jgi:hypothetical protein